MIVVMMWLRAVTLTVIAGLAAACSPAVPTGVAADPAAYVLRGPVTPVCRVGVPCDAPFSALFHVREGGVEVARFRSDSGGRFRLTLPPGTYLIVPDSTAPLMGAGSQSRTVTIAGGRLIPDTLEFDTGIR